MKDKELLDLIQTEIRARVAAFRKDTEALGIVEKPKLTSEEFRKLAFLWAQWLMTHRELLQGFWAEASANEEWVQEMSREFKLVMDKADKRWWEFWK
jgi:hypothetical protein